jgi:predicted transcriptional regulator
MKVLFTSTFMIDFVCKEFKVEDVIKCAVNVTKSYLTVIIYFVSGNGH